MKVSVSTSKVNGEVFAPPSKSYTHRAITIAALSDDCVIHRPLMSADTLASIRAAEALGASIEKYRITSYNVCYTKLLRMETRMYTLIIS